MKYLKLILLGLLTNLTVNNTNAATNATTKTELINSELFNNSSSQIELVDQFDKPQSFEDEQGLDKELDALNVEKNKDNSTKVFTDKDEHRVVPALQFNKEKLYYKDQQCQSDGSNNGSQVTSANNSGRDEKENNEKCNSNEVDESKVKDNLQNSDDNTNIKNQFSENTNTNEPLPSNIEEKSQQTGKQKAVMNNKTEINIKEQSKHIAEQKLVNDINSEHMITKQLFENDNKTTQINKNNSENHQINQQSSTKENLLEQNNTNLNEQSGQNNNKNTIVNKKEETKKHKRNQTQIALGKLALDTDSDIKQELNKKRSKSINKLNKNNNSTINLDEKARQMKTKAFEDLLENFKKQTTNSESQKLELSKLDQNAMLWVVNEIINEPTTLLTPELCKKYKNEINRAIILAIADIDNCIELLKEKCIDCPDYKINNEDLPIVLCEFNNLLNPTIDKFISYVQKNKVSSLEVLNNVGRVKKNIDNIKDKLKDIIKQIPSYKELSKIQENLFKDIKKTCRDVLENDRLTKLKTRSITYNINSKWVTKRTTNLIKILKQHNSIHHYLNNIQLYTQIIFDAEHGILTTENMPAEIINDKDLGIIFHKFLVDVKKIQDMPSKYVRLSEMIKNIK